MPRDAKQLPAELRVATAEEVRAFMAGMDDVQGRCDAATGGPWFATPEFEPDPNPDWAAWTVGPDEHEGNWGTDGGYSGYGMLWSDADFSAHARTDLPAALAVIRAQQAAMTQMQEAMLSLCSSMCPTGTFALSDHGKLPTAWTTLERIEETRRAATAAAAMRGAKKKGMTRDR